MLGEVFKRFVKKFLQQSWYGVLRVEKALGFQHTKEHDYTRHRVTGGKLQDSDLLIRLYLCDEPADCTDDLAQASVAVNPDG